jgi:hypothetical protein
VQIQYLAGGDIPKALVAPHQIHRNPRVRAVIEFMNSNLETRIFFGGAGKRS